MKSKLCDDKNRNIYIGNFNCEDIWNKDNTIKLPTLDLKEVRSVIYNLEELIIYLQIQRILLYSGICQIRIL